MSSLTNPLMFLGFFLVAILSLAWTSHAKSTTNDLINDMCKKTPDPTTCETILRADPRSRGKGAKGLTLIMISDVKSLFSDTIAYTTDRMERTRDPYTVQAMKTCIRYYHVVADKLCGMAIQAVKVGNMKKAEAAMMESGNKAESCMLEFEEKIPSPFVEQTQMLRGVCDVAVSMIRSLK